MRVPRTSLLFRRYDISLYVDLKYVNLISHRLEGFTKKKENLFLFRCPVCHDSQKSKIKKRGYLHERSGEMYFKCFNCLHSCTFTNFLKDIDPFIYNEYCLETFSSQGRLKHTYVTPNKPQATLPKSNPINLPSILSLSSTHPARFYLENRKIPEKFLGDLFFAEDFKKFASEFSTDEECKNLKSNDPRIVIPFYTKDRDVHVIQGRALDKSSLRYITIKKFPEALKIFGMDRFDPRQPGYVVEGPIDSMFLQNCIANAAGDLESVDKVVDKRKTISVSDNEPRNKQIVFVMEKLIDSDHQVFVWPEYIREKDINDLILAGWSQERIVEIINNHTYSGLSAKLKLTQWRKC